MPVIFVLDNQLELLAEAMFLTESQGFMGDAKALACKDKDTGRLLAIGVYQNLSTAASEIHFATTDERVLLRRDLMAGFAAYGFRWMKSPKLVAPIAVWNVAAQIAALKSGFYITGYLGGGAIDGSDAIVLTLIEQNCRWLPPPPEATPAHDTAADALHDA
jgi:hypothetical protein